MKLKLTIIILITGIVFLSGCLEQEPVQNESSECVIPSDCDGRIHIQCVGAWQCIYGKCTWQCSGQHLELPREEGEGLTG